jgi:cytochrome c peroxidase
MHPVPLALGGMLFGCALFLPDRKQRATAFMVCAALVVASGISVPQMQAAEKGPAQPASVTHVGNCVACHTPPDFTDFRFHNNGATQEEYDALHGVGSFARLFIPDLSQREKKAAPYLPATPRHPGYKETMRAEPLSSDPRLVDLGMWNIYANPDYPAPQAKMARLLCGDGPCDAAATLPKAIALFKTPTLRDLADSQPYMHNGRLKDIEQVLMFYRQMSAMARAGKVRNGDPQLAGISIDADDARALAAFLRSLTEDYEQPLPEWKR